MEGLRFRMMLLLVIMLVASTVFHLSARASYVSRSEEWLESHTPVSFGNYLTEPGPEGTVYSYKMDEATYKVLQPSGICARVFKNGGKDYDVVVIASRSKESFHDPRQCFSAQGYTLGDSHITDVRTKTRGVVPVTVVKMTSPNNGEMFAAYCYKGPSGFTAYNRDLKISLFIEQLKGNQHLDSAFYRFIPLAKSSTEADLLSFIGDYLDAAKSTSQGEL